MALPTSKLPHTPIERIEYVLQGAIGLTRNPKIAIAADAARIRRTFEILLNNLHLLEQAIDGNHHQMPMCHAEVLQSSLEASHWQSIEEFEELLEESLTVVREEEQKEEEPNRKGFGVRLQVVQDYVSDLRTLLSSSDLKSAPPCHGEVPRRGLESIKAGLSAVPLEHSSLPSSQDPQLQTVQTSTH